MTEREAGTHTHSNIPSLLQHVSVDMHVCVHTIIFLLGAQLTHRCRGHSKRRESFAPTSHADEEVEGADRCSPDGDPMKDGAMREIDSTHGR